MGTPDRAPRRKAAEMTTQVASGMPVPGANASTYTRKTASAADGDSYMKQRSAGKSGLNPGSVPNTKVNK